MKQKLLIGVLSASVILGGAVAVGAANKDSDDAGNSQKTTESKEMISIAEAQKIALSKAEGSIESVELESRLGKQYYDVEIENGNGNKDYDIHIDAYTGEVQSVKEERDDDDNDDRDDRDELTQSTSTNIISDQKAIEIAEKAVKGTVTEMDLDDDDGRIVFEFELNTSQGEAEVNIDALTGKVLDVEYDDSDDDNDDDLDD